MCVSLSSCGPAGWGKFGMWTTDFRSEKRIACVGDSITAGSDSVPSIPYPSHLQMKLGNNYKVLNFGISGTTLTAKGDKPYRDESMCVAAKDFEPEIVIIMLGTNDTKSINWSDSPDFKNVFKTDLKGLVTSFRDLPDTRKVYVCLPCWPVSPNPKWAKLPERIETEIDWINGAVDEINQTPTNKPEPVRIIDMNKPLKNKPVYFPDKLHPNTKGACLLADAAYKALVGSNPTVTCAAILADN